MHKVEFGSFGWGGNVLKYIYFKVFIKFYYKG